MAKSSTVAARNGSAYWDRPIQFWLVLPRFDGRSVIFVLVPTGFPLRYSVPVLPESVTARWLKVFNGSDELLLICCSPPAPLVVMANRTPVPPPLTVRNMLTLVPVPKSNTRDQLVVADGLTHAETVKFVSPL